MNRMIRALSQIRLRSLAGAFLACLAGGVPQAQAAFDPVNDDTDIFLANPNIDSQRPNVLLFIDNTANWSRNVAGQAIFINEKSALVDVINNLGDEFNVGTMLFPETGSPNDSVDGGYVRFGIRRMQDPAKSKLSGIYSAMDENGDKGNNNTVSLGMLEVYRYYTGGFSRASHGKIKSDYTANPTHPTVTPTDIGEHPLPANPTSSSRYTSPIVHECQKNFLIYISNGGANENASALAVSESELSSLGYSTSTPIPLTPNGQQSNWMDEWADYMAHADLNGVSDGEPHVNTYVVEVDPGTTGQGPAMTALLKSVANKGNGEYFAVSSTGSGTAIVDALNKIFNEIQAVNSVFASTTLPVSVNVRGTNLNQVYVGVFRPDANKAPRWYGNLKMYRLGFDDTTSTLFLADANPPDVDGNLTKAENPVTGFINPNSPSFWTLDEATDFWGWRNVEENGVGGASDYPDGDLVEKGGAAQQQRIAYAVSQGGRNLYTCTGAGCVTGAALSTMPFSTTNTDITPTSMGLGTIAVSSLSAAYKQTATMLTDSLPASLTPFLGSTEFTLNNGAAGNAKAITGITTSRVQAVTGLNNSVTLAINSLTRPTTGSNKDIATAVVSAGHGFTNGQTVVISGAADSNYNGSKTINVIDDFTFTYLLPVNNATTPDTGSPVVTAISTTVTASVTGHGLSSGTNVVLAGVVPSAYNGNYTITVVNGDNFTFTTGAGMPAITDISSATISSQSTTATVTLPSHGYADGSYVDIAGAVTSTYNGQWQISVVDANTFTYNVGVNLPNATTPGTAAQGNLSVTATAVFAHGFNVGDTITVSGGIPNGYNGSFTVTSRTPDDPSATVLTFSTVTPMPANLGTPVYITPTGASSIIYANLGTKNHGLAIPNQEFDFTTTHKVIVSGATGPDAGQYNTGPGGADAVFYGFYGGDPAYSFVGPPGPGGCCEQWFFYPGNVSTPASGNPVVKLFTDTAFITVPGHGLGNPRDIGPDNEWNTADDSPANTSIVSIEGAANAAYNRTDVVATVIDANTLRYPLATTAVLGDDPSTNIKLSIKTTTATARVVGHGFSSGDSVDIVGAIPTAFNSPPGGVTVTVLDADTFTYTLGTPQYDATGSIRASSGGGTVAQKDTLVNWVRGADNFPSPENPPTLTPPDYDVRASVHGDVLHSRPAVINYNRHGANFPNGPDGIPATADDGTNNDDVYVFYGSNDGIFRAVKGGFARSDVSEPLPGQESWGFIPEEFLTKFQRMRNNEPTISSNNKKEYFADGTIAVYVDDANNDGKLDPADSSGDKVYLYISMRRGGRMIYALDVTDPDDPKLLWRAQGGVGLFTELGQTWSAPQVTTVAGHSNPVLVFGAGYDPRVEDIDPSRIRGFTASSVEIDGPTFIPRTMGRGIYVLDAFTGAVLFQAGPAGSDTSDASYHVVAGMDYAIPSDVVVITDRFSVLDNRAYVGDTGGNMWRVDLTGSISNWRVSKLASITDTSTLPSSPAGLRKFLFPPDVVYDELGEYDAVLIGSGDREHPFDTQVVNRMYMFKDTGIGSTAVHGSYATDSNADGNGDDFDADGDSIDSDTEGDEATITESGDNSMIPILTPMYDATDNCIQDDAVCTGAEQATAIGTLASATGWYITLAQGEKLVGNAVTLNSVTFFNTNQPSQGDPDSCESDLGIARQYGVLFDDATALLDQNFSGTITAADRSEIHPGGGYLPSPVPVVVEIDGKVHEGVISGVAVDTPPGSLLNARLRKFWYKEIDD